VKPKRRYYKEYDYVYYTIKYSQVLHREDGPAVIYPNEAKEWWRYGRLHRVGGPAIEYSTGQKEWLVNGEYHREDGPAVVGSYGFELWYLKGIRYSKEEWFEKLPEEQKAKMLFSEYFIK
jgi:hypothetical protein